MDPITDSGPRGREDRALRGRYSIKRWETSGWESSSAKRAESLRGIIAEEAAAGLEENLRSAPGQGHLLGAFAGGLWLLRPDLPGWQPHGPGSGAVSVASEAEGPRSRCAGPGAVAQQRKQPRPRPP